MASSDTLVNPQAQDLLQCLQDALGDHPYFAIPPGVVSIRVGERAVIGVTLAGADECMCGYAWVRVSSVFPTSEADFPGVLSDTQPQCGLTWGMRFEMGIKRCIDDPTQPISPDRWQEFQTRTMIDLACMREAICCFVGRQSPPAAVVPWRYSIGEFVPSGPEGMCVGWAVEISTMMEDCNGC